jgi:hypothetical protein
MLSLTCHSCDEVMEAETEEELTDLLIAHARSHGHTPKLEHVLMRIRHHNRQP